MKNNIAVSKESHKNILSIFRNIILQIYPDEISKYCLRTATGPEQQHLMKSYNKERKA